MALVTCSNCDHKISTTARSCPKCGALPAKPVYCTKCGDPMLDSATVCPGCGTARYDSTPARGVKKQADHSFSVNQPRAALPPDTSVRETAAVQPEWRCSKCSSENIQKLSVIYSEGTTSTRQGVVGLGIGERGTIGGAVGGGTSSTTLAKSVAPPIAPQRLPAVPDVGGAGAAFVGCLVFFLIGFLAFVFVMLIFAAYSDDQPNATPLLQFLLAVVISFSLGLWVSLSAASSIRQKQQGEYPSKLAAYNEAMVLYNAALATYNEAVAKWQRSYFCHRCGNIFEL
jgi:hypothetical protein